jgi:hypothetical protein
MNGKITFKIDNENLYEFDTIDLFALDYDYFRLNNTLILNNFS